MVILGLLVGGVLSGRALIRSSELRSVTVDLARYQTAVNSFRDKYFVAPGDIPNATSFWGVAAGTGSDATCYAFVSTTAATCNGNNNGMMDTSAERYRAWQHLANAGLIEGQYNGADVVPAVFGTNIPKSKAANAGFGFESTPIPPAFDLRYFPAPAAPAGVNVIVFGAITGSMSGGGGNTPDREALKPEELWNLDTKMDDGMPDSGKVMLGIFYAGLGCYSGAYPNAVYSFTFDEVRCSFFYMLG